MPWSIPTFLITDRPQLSLTISVDRTNLDVWAELGSPTLPADVVLLINSNADIRTMTMGNFHQDTIITFTLTANARIMGRGSKGGNGGETIPYGNNENQGQDGNPGIAGDPALTIPTAITVDLDMDLGFIYGGGGSGGGGGGTGGTDGNPNHNGGGGGGGAQGWDTNAGGAGGFESPSVRPGDAGTNGNQAGPGIGGNSGRLNQVPSEPLPNGKGGNGGTWGVAGDDGIDCFQFNPVPAGFNNNPGGAGGAGGASIQGVTATVNYVGALTEIQLATDPAALRGPRNVL